MPSDPTSAMRAEAIDWVVRQRASSFDQWDAFSEWLASDPMHGPIYDELASLDVDLDHLETCADDAMADVAAARPGPSRRAWLSGAVAAVLVAGIALSYFGMAGDEMMVQTAAGEHRMLKLADGSRIDVNGGSRLAIDKDRPRFARLEAGEAMFHIVHRESDPFIVQVGDATLEDVGTAFNVLRRRSNISVSVSEGAIVYNPRQQNLHVPAGNGIDIQAGGRTALHKLDPASVGNWRTGQLTYREATIAEVIEDVNRTSGFAVKASADVADLPFRGSLILTDDGDQTIEDLAALAGIRAERQADGWLLTR